jgi:hypothetical protein
VGVAHVLCHRKSVKSAPETTRSGRGVLCRVSVSDLKIDRYKARVVETPDEGRSLIEFGHYERVKVVFASSPFSLCAAYRGGASFL